MATTYHQRPSQILGITNSWEAYQLDYVTLITAQRAAQEARETPPSVADKRPGETLPDGRKVGSWRMLTGGD